MAALFLFEVILILAKEIEIFRSYLPIGRQAALWVVGWFSFYQCFIPNGILLVD